MSGTSDIEWTDVTWNPVAGCNIASAGCTNCYAMRMAARLEAMRHPKYDGTTRKSGGRTVWTGRVNVDHDSLNDPIRWKRGRRIFVNSMSDLFHEGVPTVFIKMVWATMAECPQHQFQVLTKRPERMAAMFAAGELPSLSQVWIGTSVENEAVVSRISHLVSITGMTRFVSFEPLIGTVGKLNLAGVHWAIVGGESGPNARPMMIEWVDQIKAACRQAGTAFFFKQWGGRNKKEAGRKLRGRIYDEYPHELAA
jgi:protein gp37